MTFRRICGSHVAERHDVVVIGAGMAGVTAARDAARADLDVVVLEATGRVGGRILTARDFAAAPVEQGAEFVHTAEADTWPELRAGGFETIRCEPAEGFLMAMDGRWSPELFDDPSLTAMGDLLGAVEHFDGPEQSAAEWLERRGLTGVARALADQMLTVHPLGDLDRLSMHGLRDDRVVDLERGTDWRLTAGYDALPAWIADGLDVRPGSRVTDVAWRDDGVRVRTAGGEELDATAAVCTLPVGVLESGAVRFTPDLPAAKWRALAGVEMGAVLKVLLRFEEPFWPESLTMLGCDGPVRLYWTPLYGRTEADPVLTAYVGGHRARALSALTEADATAVVLADLDRLFPREKPSQLARDARRVDWCTNEHTRGGYSFVRVGGAGARAALAAADTGALFWAGDATTTTTIAAVVHAAYATGRRAAAEVVAHLGR
jgi:monoamine oxidase